MGGVIMRLDSCYYKPETGKYPYACAECGNGQYDDKSTHHVDFCSVGRKEKIGTILENAIKTLVTLLKEEWK